MPDFSSLKAGYCSDWGRLMIRGDRRDEVNAAARRILAVRRRYETVSAATGVPWFVIGLLHLREADLDFRGHLHNGDPLSRRTTHVPAGRPKIPEPPYDWEESAMDALRFDGLHRVDDWSIERMLFEMEKFNGFGPRNKGFASGYVWSGTNIYTGGKYVADGVWDPAHMDRQLGVAAVLSRLREMDVTVARAIEGGGRAPTRAPSLADAHAAAPIVTAPTAGAVLTAGSAGGAAVAQAHTGLGILVAIAVVAFAGLIVWALLSSRRNRLEAVATAPIETPNAEPSTTEQPGAAS